MLSVTRMECHHISQGHMKTIILTQYYHPDHSATGQILHELARGLLQEGRDVEVITAQPMYAMTEKRPHREVIDGVLTTRVPSTSFDKNTNVGKVLNSISFFTFALLYTLKTPKCSLLLVVSNPPFLPAIGLLLRLIRRQPYVHLVHDIYPQIAVKLGYLRADSPLTKCWQMLNKWIYRYASRVIVLSENMFDTLSTASYVESSRLSIIHNWADGRLIVPLSRSHNSFLLEAGLESKFVCQYSGNMGLFHDLEGLMSVAGRVTDLPIEFVMIGGGGKLPKLKALAAELPNVRFLPYQPKEQLPLSLTACDVAVVTLENGIGGLAAPSKLYGILAAGRAVLAIVEENSYIKEMIETAHCGVAVRPGDTAGLEAAIRHLASSPIDTATMGMNSRKLYEERFTIETAVRSYADLLDSVEREERFGYAQA